MAFHEPPTGTVPEPVSGSARPHTRDDAALPETTALREQLAPLAPAVDGPLGPPEQWDATLRTAAGICLSSRFPLLLWWGPELRLVYNDAYRPMLGSKHPRAFGAPGHEVWPEVWHVIGPMLLQVVSGGGATWSSDQLLVLDRNGYPEECYFTFSYSPVVDPCGEVAGVFCAVTETTDRVLGERRLRTLAAMARLVGSDRRDLVTQRATTVLEGNVGDHPLALVVDVEPKGPRSALATMLAERLPTVGPGTRARLADLLRQAASTGKELRVPTEHDPALKSVVAWHAQPVVAPADAARGGARAVLLLAESATRPWDDGLRSYVQLCTTHVAGALAGVHRLDEARRRTEELAALDRAKSEFFTTVSHELRTPLTLISGPAQDALAAETRPGQRRRLELVERHTRRLTGLVDALLDFGRMESGRMEPDPEPVDLPALTRGLAESFRPAVERAGLTFVVRCEDLPEPVVVDREMYERIVLNLLSNALKYTPEGSIRLTLRGREDRVEVAVRDTGVGIAPDDLDRAFERFERLPVRPGARSREGAGIGLALVRQLTHLMGGTVTLTSRLGRGSVFTVGLPLDGPPGARSRGVPSVTPVRVADVLRDVDDWAAPSAAQEADDVERSASGRPRILVAEDNADLRRYLGDVLGEDYDIELVADGLAAVAAIRRRAPDLVVADVMMPGRDGYELVRDLRADPELAGIPVLLLSARAGASETSAGLAVGADDYLSKPFSVVELRARVASNLERAGARLRDASWRRAVLGPLHVALAITDLDGELLEVNDELAHLLGRPVPADAGADGRARWGPPDAAAPALTELRHRIARLARRGGGEEPEDVRLTHADGSPLWVRLRVGVVDGGRLGPSFAIATLRDVGAEHVARERRAAAARIAQEFTGAEDLTDVLATAVSGFGELFDGDVTVRVVVGGVERVFTASGPSDAGGFDDAAGPGRAPDDAATDRPVDRIVLGDGAGVGAGHRVCVMFPAARRVAADERVAGDLLYRAFVLACDRVVAASAFADREQHLRRAIASHEAIGQAVGILVERHRWTPAAAFERLKKVSQDSNTRLRDVADQVVESGADPGSTP